MTMKILIITFSCLLLYGYSLSRAYEDEIRLSEIKANGDTHVEVRDRYVDELPAVVALHNPLEPLD
jgi:hypothetical protein